MHDEEQNPRIGSSLDDLLKEEGILEDCEAEAAHRHPDFLALDEADVEEIYQNYLALQSLPDVDEGVYSDELVKASIDCLTEGVYRYHFSLVPDIKNPDPVVSHEVFDDGRLKFRYVRKSGASEEWDVLNCLRECEVAKIEPFYKQVPGGRIKIRRDG